MIIPEIPDNSYELAKAYFKATPNIGPLNLDLPPNCSLELVKEYGLHLGQEVLQLGVKGHDKFSGGNKFLSFIYEVAFLDIALARPAFAFFCKPERIEHARTNGWGNEFMYLLIAIWTTLDHSAPNFVIDREMILFQQIWNLSPSEAFVPAWIAGRTTWGLFSALSHALFFLLTKPDPDLSAHWKMTDGQTFEDVSPGVPGLSWLFDQINLDQSPLDPAV